MKAQAGLRAQSGSIRFAVGLCLLIESEASAFLHCAVFFDVLRDFLQDATLMVEIMDSLGSGSLCAR